MDELRLDIEDLMKRLKHYRELSFYDENSKKTFNSIVDELDRLLFDFRTIVGQIGGVRKRDYRLRNQLNYTLDGNFTKDNFIEIFFTLRDVFKMLDLLYSLVDEQK